MKKILSLVLALALCLSLAVPAMADTGDDSVVILFDSAAKLSSMISSSNLVVEYCPSENALELAAYGAGYNDPYISFNMSGLGSVNASTHKYVVLTYRMPSTNSQNGIQQIFLQTDHDASMAAASAQPYFLLERGYKYRSLVLDLSNTTNFPNYYGNVVGLRIDPFYQDMVIWDTLFVSSIVFCSSMEAAEQAAAAQTARANGSINGMSESALSGNYGADMSPIWGGSLAYNEGVFITDKKQDTPITLAYDIDRVLSVRDSTLGVEYQFGRDYNVVNGKLVINSNGFIGAAPADDWFHRATPLGDSSAWFPANDGGLTFVSDSGLYQQYQLSVTYTHSDGFHGSVPSTQLNDLPYAAYRLNNGLAERIVFIGDSITYGCFSSGLRGVAPGCPIWVDLTAAKLNAVYSGNVSYWNEGVGGTMSSWGAEAATVANITRHNPDLVVIAFGMNDQNGVTAASYKANIRSMIEQIRDYNPLCEFLLVSSMLGNFRIYQSYNTILDYRPVLNELAEEYDGVAVADVTSVHQALLARKDFYDMTSNGVNHCNDYMVRTYAQVMVASLTGDVEIISPDTVPLKTKVSADRILDSGGQDMAHYGNNDPAGTDLGLTEEETAAAYGWFACSKPISRFGYRCGNETVLNSAKVTPEAAVTKAGLATAGLFGETSRFTIQIPLSADANEVYAVAELTDGTVIDMWKITYASANQPSALVRSAFNTISIDSTQPFEDSNYWDGADAHQWLEQNPISFNIGEHSTIGVRGWALLNHAIGDFSCSVDGGSAVTGCLESGRSDVKQNVDALAEGFLKFVDISGLGAGNHSIVIKAIASDGAQFTVATLPFTIIDPVTPPEPTTEPATDAELIGSAFEAIYEDGQALCLNNAKAWLAQNDISYEKGSVNEIRLGGWAALNVPIAGFGYRLDNGSTVNGVFVDNRPGVPAGATAFRVHANVYGLWPGEHSVQAVVIAYDGTEFVVATAPFTVYDPPVMPELIDSEIEKIIVENDTIYDSTEPGEWTFEDPIEFAAGTVSDMFVSGWASASEEITGFGYSFDNGFVREGRFLVPRDGVQGINMSVPLHKLSDGEHTVDIYAITASGVYLKVCGFQVNVT